MESIGTTEDETHTEVITTLTEVISTIQTGKSETHSLHFGFWTKENQNFTRDGITVYK